MKSLFLTLLKLLIVQCFLLLCYFCWGCSIHAAATGGDPTDQPNPTIQFEANASITEDHHHYYSKQVVVNHPLATHLAADFDTTFDNYPSTRESWLSGAVRHAVPVKLKFPFLFYGHTVRTIAVVTGGFLYINEFSHKYLGFSQYIAPLMADFDTQHNSSSISYIDTGSSFWVRWNNLQLSRRRSAGNFTFQCVLYPNGTIVFDYLAIPTSVKQLVSDNITNVTVGISDAFYLHSPILFPGILLRRIIKYHSVNVEHDSVKEDTVIRFTHLLTCNQLQSCEDCQNRSLLHSFKCNWCERLRRCGSGMDRHREQWLMADCWKSAGSCGTGAGELSALSSAPSNSQQGHSGPSLPPLLLLLLAVACAFVSLCGLAAYAYRNPNSRPGRWLIEHRPSRLRQRLGGSVYFRRGPAYRAQFCTT